jgi:hypothetical protein
MLHYPIINYQRISLKLDSARSIEYIVLIMGTEIIDHDEARRKNVCTFKLFHLCS